MIHTTVRQISASGLNFAMDPKEMMSPKGIEKSNVRTKSRQLTRKPSSNSAVMDKKFMLSCCRCWESGHWSDRTFLPA